MLTPFIRASSFLGYFDLVRELGGKPEEFLSRHHITRSQIEHQDNQVPLRSFLNILEDSAADLGAAHFGMQLALRQGFLLLGPIGLIGLNAPTVGDALREMQKYLGYYCLAAVSEIDATEPSLPRVTFDLSLSDGPPGRQIFEAGIANIFHEITTMMQGRFVPERVLFRHSPGGDLRFYREYFGSPIYFEQDVNAVVLRRTDLTTRLKTANPLMQQLVSDYIKTASMALPQDLPGQIRLLIRRLLPVGLCSLKRVAEELSMNTRTLQRHLQSCNVIFSDVVDEVRKERARELLENSTLPLAHITTEIGYAEQAVFNRACNRWFGTTPRAIRSRAGDGR